MDVLPAQTSGRSPLAGAPARLLTRRKFLGLAGSSALGLAVYAGEIERHEIDVVHRTMALDGLPKAFSGFRIAQISDIHLEEFTETFFLQEVVNKVNTLRPDMVVLTGDFVSDGPLPNHFAVGWAYHCAEMLNKLECRLRYAVLGNHDALVSAPAVTDALISHNIPVLNNQSVPLERNRGRIWLAGIADAVVEAPNLAKALPRQRDVDREPLILLAHEPDFADRVVGHKVALILSGHTHGGQVRIPFMPLYHLPVLGRKYVEGSFKFHDGMQLYVNRGIGTVGVPFRFRCPPEITLFTLVDEIG